MRIAFHGDTPMLLAARNHARHGFDENRQLSEDTKIVDAIKYAQEVAKILRENVVQGMSNEGENGRYKLNIHEHTERGDNDSIKKGKTKGQATDLSGAAVGQCFAKS